MTSRFPPVVAAVRTVPDVDARAAVASAVLGLRAGHPAVPVALRAGGTDPTGAVVAASTGTALVVVGRALDPGARSSATAATAVAGRAAGRRSAVALSWSADHEDPGHPATPRRQGRRR